MRSFTRLEYGGGSYPAYQASGNAKRFCEAYALEYCKGRGLDVGCGDWPLDGARPIDFKYGNFTAMSLPPGDYDYIFSSHCLEHLDNWVRVLDYWVHLLKEAGVLFLYLPDFSQEYWRPWNNRKHVSVFTPEIIGSYMRTKFKVVDISGVDLNNSFIAVGYDKL
jgi:SAM-dependent methyltransferase